MFSKKSKDTKIVGERHCAGRFFLIVILLCTILQQNKVTYITYYLQITTILLIQAKLKKIHSNQLLLLLKHYSNN